MHICLRSRDFVLQLWILNNTQLKIDRQKSEKETLRLCAVRDTAHQPFHTVLGVLERLYLLICSHISLKIMVNNNCFSACYLFAHIICLNLNSC